MTTPQYQMEPEWEHPTEELEVIHGTGAMSPESKAEVDTQITTAKRYPRSIRAFKQQALEMATFDEETAEGCFYALRRSGKPIEGPSIRLAEIIVSAWGNVRADAKVIAIGDRDLTAEAMTWDLEKNVAIRVQVKRRITGKDGKRYSDDMIVVTGNAACAIALRNSVFKVIPMVYTKSVYQEARKVAIGDVKTLAAKRAAMVEHFGKMGVSEAEVFAAVDKAGIEEVGLDELATLKGYATALKEGDTTVEELFRPSNGHAEDLKAKTQANAQALRDKLPKPQAAEQPTTETAPPPAEPEQTQAPVDELADLRNHVTDLFNSVDKKLQKNLLAGKPAVSKMDGEQLQTLQAEIEKVSG
jgi:hypothetical protein